MYTVITRLMWILWSRGWYCNVRWVLIRCILFHVVSDFVSIYVSTSQHCASLCIQVQVQRYAMKWMFCAGNRCTYYVDHIVIEYKHMCSFKSHFFPKHYTYLQTLECRSCQTVISNEIFEYIEALIVTTSSSWPINEWIQQKYQHS